MVIITCPRMGVNRLNRKGPRQGANNFYRQLRRLNIL
ncbi:hypothetical protein BY457_101263 [Marinilabilia salmonicolor]|nr:hypothetical protein BY457_101263 [Marinilabilia salmonicolor]